MDARPPPTTYDAHLQQLIALCCKPTVDDAAFSNIVTEVIAISKRDGQRRARDAIALAYMIGLAHSYLPKCSAERYSNYLTKGEERSR
jgi:hypothetical protein